MIVRHSLEGVSIVDCKCRCKEIAPLSEAIDGEPVEGILHLKRVIVVRNG